MKIDKEAVSSLAQILKENDLTEIEYEFDSVKIRVSKNIQQNINLSSYNPVGYAAAPVVTTKTATENTPAASDLTKHPGVVFSKMVGTIYLSPGPGAKFFVSVGEKVEVGQTMYIIEAMKVMNMIKASAAGTIKHVFVKDSQPVEYGDPILIIE